MFSLVVIQPNGFNPNQLEKGDYQNLDQFNGCDYQKISHYNIDQFRSLTQGYLTIEEVTEENVANKLVEYLGLEQINLEPHEIIADTKYCYETRTCLFEMCHLSFAKNNIEQRGWNMLATYLGKDSEGIDGPAVLIASHLEIDTDDMYNCKIQLEDILQIVMSKDMSYAVRVPCSGDIEPVIVKGTDVLNYYTFKKIGDLPESMKEKAVLKFNLAAYFQGGKVLNERVCQLFNKDGIFGDVILCAKLGETLFDDLPLDIADKLITLAFKSNSLELVSEEVDPEKDSKGREILKSRYRILHKRLNLWFSSSSLD